MECTNTNALWHRNCQYANMHLHSNTTECNTWVWRTHNWQVYSTVHHILPGMLEHPVYCTLRKAYVLGLSPRLQIQAEPSKSPTHYISNNKKNYCQNSNVWLQSYLFWRTNDEITWPCDFPTRKNVNTTFLRPFHIPDAIMLFQVTKNLRWTT